jgi:glutamyl-Q tRNA(Asp) synthetase
MQTDHNGYIGRFAPSPSGALHFGSLLAALASFLDARARQGTWLLRMEDLDPAREPAGAADQILFALELFELHWDGPVVYQSQRLDAYADALNSLQDMGLLYACDCSRQRIRAMGGVYDNRCRQRSQPPAGSSALRISADDTEYRFTDRIQGDVAQIAAGDFVLKRRDGLYAYQLAVVVDDAWQGVTDIVRGYDLLDSTPRQLYLQHLLHYPVPQYAHIPVAVNAQGQKLSKQHFAKALTLENSHQQMFNALQFLGQNPPAELHKATVAAQLEWATAHWDIQRIPMLANIRVSSQFG